MKNKIIIFALLATLTAFPTIASAYDFSAVAPSGQTLYYNINPSTNTATVVPENDSYPYYTTAPTGELVIPSSITYNEQIYSVTSIGTSAFEGCSDLTSVTIPSSVTTIGNFAFESVGFQSFIIPNSVTSIGHSAFRSCQSLTSITIPSSVTSIDGNIFLYCNGLTSITVDANNTTYDSRNNCNAIIETATNKLILGCNNTTIPNTVTAIGDHAFAMFQSFPTISIPFSITSIGDNAFYTCFEITAIVVDANNTLFDSRNNCNALIETASNKLILGCKNTIIPNTVTSIGHDAFSSCSNLNSITIPSSVTSIEHEAFRSCGLTEIISRATVPPALSYSVFYDIYHDAYSVISVHVPCGSLAAYQAADGWSNFTNIQEVFPYTVSVSSNDNTMGTAALTTTPTCSNNTATLTATPNCGYRFTQWNDGNTDNPRTVTVTSDTSLTAVFEATDKIAIPCASGQTLYYTLDCQNHTATVISENNSFPDSYTNYPTGSLIIPSSIEYGGITYSVTRIGDYAFNGCSGLTGSLTIPSSVTSIGAWAFFRCSGLTGALTIPNSVTSIGFEAFYDCSGLTGTLTIPNSVTQILTGAFSGCSGLTSIVVESGNSVYDSRDNCNALIEIETNKLIAGCKNTIIPNSVTSIGQSAFSKCIGLTGTLTIPPSVTAIGDYAFKGCSGLTGPLTIPNTVTSIGCNAFDGCTGLTGPITISNSMTSIRYGLFYDCTGLTGSLAIPNSVTSIESWAFWNCNNLTSVTIPNSMTTINHGAFSGCSSLIEIISLATNPPSLSDFVFNGVPTDIPIYVPCGSLANYQSADVWSSFTNIQGIPGETVSEFDAVTPSNQTLHYIVNADGFSVTLTGHENNISGDLIIPSTVSHNCNTYSVTSIGDSAFYHCTGLTSATIPNSVSNIGINAFEGCRNLATVNIPTSVTTIKTRTFCECGLTSVVIPNSVTSIGRSAFHACGQLSSITIPNSVTTIAMEALRQTGLTSVTIPNSVTSIGGAAFAESRQLASVNIPNSITSIDFWTFMGCTSLTSVTIPSSVTTIDNQVFRGCSSLASIEVESGNTVYDSRDNCNAIIETTTNTLHTGCKNTVIPNSVTSIRNDAFYGCSGLTSVTIPNSVTSIGNEAFRECSGLTEITSLATTAPTLGSYVFNGVSTNIPVYVPCGSLAAYQSATHWSNFTNIQEMTGCSYSITVSSADEAMGTVTGGGTYANGATATLTATPSSGYLFYHWSDGNSDNPRTITVTSDTTITAYFTLSESTFGSSEPSPSTSCGEYQWPATPSTHIGVQIKQKHDHVSAFAAQGWDTVVTLSSPSVELSCMPYIPVQHFNGQYTVDEIPYNPADTSFHAGTMLPLGADDQFNATATSLPFPFYFFGVRKNAFVIGANGLVSFNTAAAGKMCPWSYSAPLPWVDGASGIPNPVTYMRDAIYGIYEDTYPQPASLTGNDGIYYGVQGYFPERKIVCSWNNIPQFSCTSNRSSYQIVCYEGSNIIEVHVKQRQACASWQSGRGIIGIQNATGQPQVPSSDPSSSTYHVVPGSPAAFWPTGKNIFPNNLSEVAYRFTPQGTTNYTYKWYRLLDDGLSKIELTTDPNDPNGYYIPMDNTGTCPTLTRAVVSPTEPAKYIFELQYRNANNDTYLLHDTCTVGVNFDTIIHINMAMVGDSLFTQEDLSMVVAHQDATYIRLSFNVEPSAERIEVLDQAQNLVATFYNATEEHIFRLTTGLYTIRAVFPGGATFEGTIDFTNELQE